MENKELDIIEQKKAEQRKSKRRENLLALGLISPYILIFFLFTVIPVICGFIFSFMRYNPYNPEDNQFLGITNYVNIFNFDLPVSKSFWESFSTMLVFDVVMVPVLIIIPLYLAYRINFRPPGYKIFRAIVYLPSVVSVSVMGIIFKNIFAGDGSGLINAWFGANINWLGGEPWNGDFLRWFVIFIASIWWQTGTNFIIFSGALRNVPKVLYEACEMDGGNKLSKIWYVLLPNIKSSIQICLFNTLISYISLYGQPLVLNAIDNEAIAVSPMMFIQKYLSSGLTYARQTGYICACAIVFGLIAMFISIVERKFAAEKKRNNRHSNIRKECKEYQAYLSDVSHNSKEDKNDG